MERVDSVAKASPDNVAPAERRYREPASFSLTAQGQALGFYPSGQDRLRALLKLIDSAQVTLRIAFYIFSPDASGILVRDAIVAAARRGVDVSVIVDGFGASVDAEFFAGLEEAGGCFCCFMPRWSARYLIRNHQKIVVADGRIAMLGALRRPRPHPG